MSDEKKNPSEKPYDPHTDPDADPGQKQAGSEPQQPDQAEGEDDERAEPS